MTKVSRHLVVPIALAGCLSLPGTAWAELVVVANPGIKIDVITADHAEKLWLGVTKLLPDGSRVQVVDQAEGQPAREEFHKKVTSKDLNQLKAYWAKLVFTGKASAPDALSGDAAVKAWVAKTPNGLGYMEGAAADGSVKILWRIK